MEQALTFRSKVEDGHLSHGVRESIGKALWRFDGQTVEIVIRKAAKRISDPQRRYYFAVIVPAYQMMFAEHCGEAVTKDDAHVWIKTNVTRRGRDVKGPDGRMTFVPDSLMKRSTADQEADNEKCRAHLATFGIEIPLPDERAS